MELYHLRTFTTVAEEGNLTRAAERLFTSQPAISAHIKALESEWELRLFLRTPRGMQLTPEGEELLPRARELLAAARALQDDVRGMRGQVIGSARIGVNTDGDFLQLSALLTWLAEAHPQLELRFIQDVSGNILEDLRHGALDCGFFFGENPYQELTAVALAEIPFVVCAPAGWKQRVVSAPWEELAAMCWIFPVPECPYTQIYARLFSDQGSQPKKVAYASSEPAIDSLVKAGSGLAVIRESSALAMERAGEIVIWKQSRYSLPLSFGFPARRTADPLVAALLSAVREIWPVDDIALSGAR